MIDALETFLLHIPDFNSTSASKKIDFFAYFLLINNGIDGITPKQIKNCFELLHIPPYSNISYYLSTNSKGKQRKFIKSKDGRYHLERTCKEIIDTQFGKILLPKASSSKFLPYEIFVNTRGYIQQISEQAINCYDLGLYDACSVLTRKLLEVLIIEYFERYGIDNLIKKNDGSFYYLSDLIMELLKTSKWNISRNAKQALPKIKKTGDLSAHNRRYIARKNDLDSIQNDLRIVVEELIHLIDYKNWK